MVFAPLLLALASAEPTQHLHDSASATWVAVDTPAAMQQNVDSAVDDAVSAFSFISGRLARPHLQRAATYCRSIEVASSPDEWSTRCADTGKAFSRAWSPTAVAFTSPKGESTVSHLSATKDSVHIEFRGEEGARIVDYAFTGTTMTVAVSIESPQMPAPLRWSFEYRRQP
jgi:hypothetical protein